MSWAECRRCPRHISRAGGCSPQWPSSPAILVVSAHPDRSELGGKCPHPTTGRVIEHIKFAFELSNGDVAHEYLVSCGDQYPTPEEIASCSPRWLKHLEGTTSVQAVVVMGASTEALAELAGLLKGGHVEGVPALLWHSGTHYEEPLRALAGLLRKPMHRALHHNREGIERFAEPLVRAQGTMLGQGIKQAKGWSRKYYPPLSADDVERHLRGTELVSPFAPTGPWPWVVLDVDRHDGLQEANFAEVRARLCALLPGAFVIQSSDSRGLHIYVRLPPGTRYETGALFMRAFLLLHRLRYAERVLQNGKSLRSELVETKNHPPRLPFGVGSHVPGCTQPLSTQIEWFLTWAKTPKFGDFERCRREVERRLSIPKRWDGYARHKLRSWVKLQETGADEVPLHDGDPWKPFLPQLPPHLRVIASTGIPSYGTRTHWTGELLRALTTIVPATDALTLMEQWLRNRDHNSSDIDCDMDGVSRQLSKQVQAAYRNNAGVPESHWVKIERLVRQAVQDARTGAGSFPRLKNPSQLVLEEVLATAFYISCRFYREGVQTRPIPHMEFAEFAGKNAAHDVQEVLTWGMSWLSFQRKARQGLKAREFRLLLWPAPPLEKTVILPPSGLPPRKYWVGT